MTASGQLRLPSCWSAVPVKSSVSASAGDGARAARSAGRPRAPRARPRRVRSPSAEVGEAGAGAPLGVVEDLGERRRAASSAPTRSCSSVEPAAPRPARPPAGRAGRRGAGRGGASARLSSAIASSSRTRGSITTPSSASVRLSAGIEPGVGPPTSAWWARLAANAISAVAGEHRGDHGDVGQVGAAAVRVVEDPRALRGVVLVEDRGDRGRHRPEVHGDVLGLHHHLARGGRTARSRRRGAP